MLSLHHLGIHEGRYRYIEDLRQLGHPPEPAVAPQLLWPASPCPVAVSVLAGYLHSHLDQEFAEFVLSGLRDGFHVGYRCPEGAGLCANGRNHPSSLANRQVISNYIMEELAAGRMVGPVAKPHSMSVHCSPVGLVPKGRETGRWRMIVDLSYPSLRSVNDGNCCGHLLSTVQLGKRCCALYNGIGAGHVVVESGSKKCV